MSFNCPKCGSYMFGSSFTNGIHTYHCHGNEEWTCDFSCNTEYFDKHFSDLPQKTEVQKPSNNIDYFAILEIVELFMRDSQDRNIFAFQDWLLNKLKQTQVTQGEK